MDETEREQPDAPDRVSFAYDLLCDAGIIIMEIVDLNCVTDVKVWDEAVLWRTRYDEWLK